MNEPVIIHKAAELRLGQIWDYTVEKWGEEQADSYLDLHGGVRGVLGEAASS